MTVARAFSIVVASSIVFAIAGGLLGFLVGTHDPGYYEIVFRLDLDKPHDLPRLGTILGFTQGLGAGLAVGIAVLACVTWYEVNKLNCLAQSPES